MLLILRSARVLANYTAGVSVGPFSKGGTMNLSFSEIFDSSGLIFTRPTTIPITGGWGIQMPGLGSGSIGVLALVSGPSPFSGY